MGLNLSYGGVPSIADVLYPEWSALGQVGSSGLCLFPGRSIRVVGSFLTRASI